MTVSGHGVLLCLGNFDEVPMLKLEEPLQQEVESVHSSANSA